MDNEPGTITIGERAGVCVSHDSTWVIVYTEDGSGQVTTISLTVQQALDLAKLIKGSAITASGVRQ
jgi:hypothetical protein